MLNVKRKFVDDGLSHIENKLRTARLRKEFLMLMASPQLKCGVYIIVYCTLVPTTYGQDDVPELVGAKWTAAFCPTAEAGIAMFKGMAQGCYISSIEKGGDDRVFVRLCGAIVPKLKGPTFGVGIASKAEGKLYLCLTLDFRKEDFPFGPARREEREELLHERYDAPLLEIVKDFYNDLDDRTRMDLGISGDVINRWEELDFGKDGIKDITGTDIEGRLQKAFKSLKEVPLKGKRKPQS